MSRQQSHGRRLVTMGDRWRAVLAGQPRPPAPIAPAEHIGASWCEHGWQCSACPGATDARPDPSAEHPEERD